MFPKRLVKLKIYENARCLMAVSIVVNFKSLQDKNFDFKFFFLHKQVASLNHITVN